MSRRKRSCSSVDAKYMESSDSDSPPLAMLRSYSSNVEADNKKKRCEKVWCEKEVPICFAKSSERCCGSAYTTKWHHISIGEHFCNECYTYYSMPYKAGYAIFSAWKEKWLSNSKCSVSVKLFMCDKILPYWIQCTSPICGKWRQISREHTITNTFIASYQCGDQILKKNASVKYCSIVEDNRVRITKSDEWMQGLKQFSYLLQSPAATHLHCYYPDGVGLSPTCPSTQVKSREKNAHFKDLANNFKPFYQPNEPGRALCVRPDIMEYDESQEFSELNKHPLLYLALRNLILVLWYNNVKKWLVPKDCIPYIICRGLLRIRFVKELFRILTFLTLKGIVNTGILHNPPQDLILHKKSIKTALVVGSGVSGLAAARQLKNFGFEVTVLEAKNRIGGRICDSHIFDFCVGMGAKIVTGCINNPFSVMAEQAACNFVKINEKCDIINEKTGKLIPEDVDKNIEQHFNLVLDFISAWRKEKSSPVQDVDLDSKIKEINKKLQTQNSTHFTEEEESMFNFHISNLEFACGSELSNVSSLQWDQNEVYSQFDGDHAIIQEGYSTILNKLAYGIDIKLNKAVKKIDYSKSEVVFVETEDDSTYKADKVLVAVPLSILQKNLIDFLPRLPHKKVNAFNQLGCGLIEKVGLKFSKKFWSRKVGSSHFFGRISGNYNDKYSGLFYVFYDVSTLCSQQNSHVLVSFISGRSLKLVQTMTDKDVVSMCVAALARMFPEQQVPFPTEHFVSHWADEPYINMSYTYVKTNGRGEAYDVIAQDIAEKIFFAGECTNRHFPLTATGAYLSGVLQASRIYASS